MNAIDRILENMNTPQGQEKIKKILEEYFAQEDARNIKMQELLSNTDYIAWLVSFTVIHSSFYDDNWLYFPEKISKEDLEQVNNLHLMYRGIERYANRNYIYPTEFYFGNFYKIRIENIGFEIGMIEEHGRISFFCNRVQIENQNDFIDFNDIVNNKEYDNVNTIKNKLNEDKQTFDVMAVPCDRVFVVSPDKTEAFLSVKPNPEIRQQQKEMAETFRINNLVEEGPVLKKTRKPNKK